MQVRNRRKRGFLEGQDRAGQDRTKQNGTEQDRTEQDGTEQNGTEQSIGMGDNALQAEGNG